MRKQKEGFTIKVKGPEFKGLVEMLKERGINLHIEDVNVEEDIFTLRAFASDDVYVLKQSDMKCEEPSDMKCEQSDISVRSSSCDEKELNSSPSERHLICLPQN